MKALVTGFHMLYRLSPDSKYPWSGENTGPIEIPVLNIPLLGLLNFVMAVGGELHRPRPPPPVRAQAARP